MMSASVRGKPAAAAGDGCGWCMRLELLELESTAIARPRAALDTATDRVRLVSSFSFCDSSDVTRVHEVAVRFGYLLW